MKAKNTKRKIVARFIKGLRTNMGTNLKLKRAQSYQAAIKKLIMKDLY